MAEPTVPDRPIYWFNGKRQSAAFSEGVDAARALLMLAEGNRERGTRRLDDREFAEAHAERIVRNMEQGNDCRLGYAAALANWIAIQRHSTAPIETWIPLRTPPAYRIVNDGDYYEPGPRSLLFEVDGAAISVSEELFCLRYGPADCDSIDIDLVRERGKPISRERFDELRGMAETTEDANG